MKKWLEKYNDGGGIESTMGGLTDKGFNYNGAWGGTMQFGGNLPGATGNMYARHGAPSNGKYAKKTKASAQNGIKQRAVADSTRVKQPIITEKETFTDSRNLPEITIVGSKDKQTRDFYNNILDEIRKEVGNPESEYDSEMGTYSGIMALGKQYGFPKVNPAIREGLFKNVPGHYNPLTKTIYANNIDTWIAEMAHHVQMKDNFIEKGMQWLNNDLPQYVKKPIIDLKNELKYGKDASPLDYSDIDFAELKTSTPYTKKGTVENEAHRIIEPLLKKKIKSISKNTKDYKNGGRLYSVADEGIEILPDPNDPERKYKLSAVVASAKELLNPMLRLKDPQVYDKWHTGRIEALKQGPQVHRDYLDKNTLKQYLSAKEVKDALDKERPGFYEDYIGALKGIREYDEMQGKQRASLVGGVEGEKPFEELNYGWRFATQPVNIGMSFRENPEEDFTYTYDRKTGEYRKIYERKRDGGKMMSYYQAGLDFEPKTISENGVEIAQNGNGVPKYYLRKQAFRESEYDPNAISPMGAIGLTQIMPNTYKDYLKATGDKPGDLTDPKESVKVQKWIMDDLYNAGFINKPNQSNEVRMAKVFASYNIGRGKASRLLKEAKEKGIDIYNTLDWIKEFPKETRTYIDQILLNKDPDFEERYQKALKTSPYAKLYEEAEEAPKKFESNVPTIFDLGVKPKSQKKGGKVKKDNDGYWNPENWGEPVEIDSNEITMEGVYEPLLGISDTGDVQMMYPGEDYTFDGESVTEYPVAKNGGWLDKYK